MTPPPWRQTLCARWLKFLVHRDPRMEKSIAGLMAEFAQRERLKVADLELRFHQEEADAREAEEAKRMAQLRRIAQKTQRKRECSAFLFDVAR